MSAHNVVLRASELRKTFRKPFSRRRVDAVKGVSFDVFEGEIFGFLGPNGAGKTTTIKMLTGLISPTAGCATLLGERVPSTKAMRRVGFLPENPYVYPYLTPREFVALCGRLNGMRGKALAARVDVVLERVGVAYASDRPVLALSKGMLQRTGLAAALVHEPEMLLLDEPMSGLDPVGRKEIRDLIVDEQRAGRTVFFSSHILSDVEMLCDRVCILRKGEVTVSGKLRDLLHSDSKKSEVTLRSVPDALKQDLANAGAHVVGDAVVVEVEGDEKVQALIARSLGAGAHVEQVVPKRETLEDLFVRNAL